MRFFKHKFQYPWTFAIPLLLWSLFECYWCLEPCSDASWLGFTKLVTVTCSQIRSVEAEETFHFKSNPPSGNAERTGKKNPACSIPTPIFSEPTCSNTTSAHAVIHLHPLKASEFHWRFYFCLPKNCRTIRSLPKAATRNHKLFLQASCRVTEGVWGCGGTGRA